MKIAFLSRQVKWGKKPFVEKRTENAFKAFSIQAKKQGIIVHFVTPKYFQEDFVVKSWVYNKKWQMIERKTKVKLVYSIINYSAGSMEIWKRIEKKVKLINSFHLVDLCFDKWKTAKFVFKKNHAQTFLVNNLLELRSAVRKIKTKKIVLKPRYGLRGLGVKIISRANLPKKIEENTLVQEFIETKTRFPGMRGEKRFDLRLMMINEQIDHAYLRVPPKGQLKANCALGAKKVIIPLAELPLAVLEVGQKIAQKIKQQIPEVPKIYSIDFLITQQGVPLVLELEAMPGFFHYDGTEKIRDNYLKNIFAELKNI